MCSTAQLTFCCGWLLIISVATTSLQQTACSAASRVSSCSGPSTAAVYCLKLFSNIQTLTVKTELAGQVRQDHLKPLLSWEGDLLPWVVYTHALLYKPSSIYLEVDGQSFEEEKDQMVVVAKKEEDLAI